MSNPSVSNKIKNKVWNDYTNKSTSERQLKNIFLSDNPSAAYGKIKDALTTQINKEVKKQSSSNNNKKSTLNNGKKNKFTNSKSLKKK